MTHEPIGKETREPAVSQPTQTGLVHKACTQHCRTGVCVFCVCGGGGGGCHIGELSTPNKWAVLMKDTPSTVEHVWVVRGGEECHASKHAIV
jgi:hypothetical protein